MSIPHNEEEEKKTIKDLQLKIDVMKKGILDEREKAKDYLARLDAQDKALKTNNDEIGRATKEKFDLQIQLGMEKSKKKPRKSFGFSDVINRIFKKDEFTQERMDKMIQECKSLREKNRVLEIKLQEENEKFDIEKVKFQTKISMEAEKKSVLNKEYNDAHEQLKKLYNEKTEIDKFLMSYSERKNSWENEQRRLTIMKEKTQEELKESKAALELIKKEELKKAEDINTMAFELTEISTKAADLEMKLKFKKEKARNLKTFKALRNGDRNKMVKLVFTPVPAEKKYVINLYEGNLNETINISKVNRCILSSKGQNMVEFNYIDVS